MLSPVKMFKMLTPTQYREHIRAARFNALSIGAPWDGRATWQLMKNIQSDEVDVNGWNSCVNAPDRITLYHEAMTLIEFAPDGSTNETNHFLMQCARIPMIDKFSLRKVYQIALNIDQLEADYLLGRIEGKTLELYQRFVALNMRDISNYA